MKSVNREFLRLNISIFYIVKLLNNFLEITSSENYFVTKLISIDNKKPIILKSNLYNNTVGVL